MTPAFKVVNIFLENLWLGRCRDGKIKSIVNCKKSHFGFDIHRKIFYVDEKEKRSQHRPLRYSRWDRYRFGWRSIYNDWWRLSTNPLTHLRAGPLIPYSCSLRASFSWLTLSKALLKSSKMRSVCFLYSVYKETIHIHICYLFKTQKYVFNISVVTVCDKTNRFVVVFKYVHSMNNSYFKSLTILYGVVLFSLITYDLKIQNPMRFIIVLIPVYSL